jgi:hypothetical protein
MLWAMASWSWPLKSLATGRPSLSFSALFFAFSFSFGNVFQAALSNNPDVPKAFYTNRAFLLDDSVCFGLLVLDFLLKAFARAESRRHSLQQRQSLISSSLIFIFSKEEIFYGNRIMVYPIKSVLAYGDTISKESAKLLGELTENGL